jgi:F420H(2)-dependent quinone reductase
VEAAELIGDERDRLYAKQAGLYPTFDTYQANTRRTIPVVALKRKS